MKITILVLLLVLPLASCGSKGGGSSNTSNPPVVVEKWGGLFRSTHGTDAIILALNRSDNNVTGTYETTSGGSGIVSGTMDSKTVALNLVQSPNCPGFFTVSGNALVPNEDVYVLFSGQDCTGIYNNGVARILKVPPQPGGTAYSGNYYGLNIQSLYFLSISTQDGTNYHGIAKVLDGDFYYGYGNFLLTTATADGQLGNNVPGCNSGGTIYILLGFTGITTEEPTPYANGSVCIFDESQTTTNLQRLKTTWLFAFSGGTVSTGAVWMTQIP